jgi:hypothetical protein
MFAVSCCGVAAKAFGDKASRLVLAARARSLRDMGTRFEVASGLNKGLHAAAKPFQSRAEGQVAERFKAPVLKTGEVQASVGSNPTLSATKESRG